MKSVSEERIQEIAKELGLVVKFNSDNPGVLNTTTGEILPLENYMKPFLQDDDYDI